MEKRRLTEKENLAYLQESQTRACFICGIVAGNPAEQENIIFEDENVIVFFPLFTTMYGYILVAPKRHVEQVTGDFSLADYLRLQHTVYVFSEAVRIETKAERVYILSLGSQQGNRHVHWHIAPLPAGVPYEKQQLHALDSANGVLEMSAKEKDALAGRIRARV
ncbi:MAG: HIT family protein [Anaerolineales bacterium]|nr:HIT family protein [Anaerolineales bacterium]